MSKSFIPFIFENHTLNNVFTEAAKNKNASNLFFLQSMNLENIEINKHHILLTDQSTLKNIFIRELKLTQIFLIDEINQLNSQLNFESEIVKINIPFKLKDIYQRIENNLIQININSERLIKYKHFTYDPSTRKLFNQSLSLRFTEKESEIFVCLLDSINKYISKKDLLNKVWSYGEGIDTHTLETHVYALRKKIENKLKIKNLIFFEEKKGYYLNKSIL